ncbi:MAG TPA: nucleolar RNA-binding Nop10p family protein [archaeon]|nr:nucleolar RNA-binding Nop10p family protein [archaeon]
MKLKKCDNHNPSTYTFKDKCECGAKTHSAHPPKFSERYGKYRRAARRETGAE